MLHMQQQTLAGTTALERAEGASHQHPKLVGDDNASQQFLQSGEFAESTPLGQLLLSLPAFPAPAPGLSRRRKRGAGNSDQEDLLDEPQDALDAHCQPMTLERLRMVFHMPREKAAEQLGVGLSSLKRWCASFNVHRWPHRKLQSLKGLMQHHMKHPLPEPEQQELMSLIQDEYNATLIDPDHELDNALLVKRVNKYKKVYSRKKTEQKKKQLEKGGGSAEDAKAAPGTAQLPASSGASGNRGHAHGAAGVGAARQRPDVAGGSSGGLRRSASVPLQLGACCEVLQELQPEGAGLAPPATATVSPSINSNSTGQEGGDGSRDIKQQLHNSQPHQQARCVAHFAGLNLAALPVFPGMAAEASHGLQQEPAAKKHAGSRGRTATVASAAAPPAGMGSLDLPSACVPTLGGAGAAANFALELANTSSRHSSPAPERSGRGRREAAGARMARSLSNSSGRAVALQQLQPPFSQVSPPLPQQQQQPPAAAGCSGLQGSRLQVQGPPPSAAPSWPQNRTLATVNGAERLDGICTVTAAAGSQLVADELHRAALGAPVPGWSTRACGPQWPPLQPQQQQRVEGSSGPRAAAAQQARLVQTWDVDMLAENPSAGRQNQQLESWGYDLEAAAAAAAGQVAPGRAAGGAHGSLAIDTQTVYSTDDWGTLGSALTSFTGCTLSSAFSSFTCSEAGDFQAMLQQQQQQLAPDVFQRLRQQQQQQVPVSYLVPVEGISAGATQARQGLASLAEGHEGLATSCSSLAGEQQQAAGTRAAWRMSALTTAPSTLITAAVATAAGMQHHTAEVHMLNRQASMAGTQLQSNTAITQEPSAALPAWPAPYSLTAPASHTLPSPPPLRTQLPSEPAAAHTHEARPGLAAHHSIYGTDPTGVRVAAVAAAVAPGLISPPGRKVITFADLKRAASTASVSSGCPSRSAGTVAAARSGAGASPSWDSATVTAPPQSTAHMLSRRSVCGALAAAPRHSTSGGLTNPLGLAGMPAWPAHVAAPATSPGNPLPMRGDCMLADGHAGQTPGSAPPSAQAAPRYPVIFGAEAPEWYPAPTPTAPASGAGSASGCVPSSPCLGQVPGSASWQLRSGTYRLGPESVMPAPPTSATEGEDALGQMLRTICADSSNPHAPAAAAAVAEAEAATSAAAAAPNSTSMVGWDLLLNMDMGVEGSGGNLMAMTQAMDGLPSLDNLREEMIVATSRNQLAMSTDMLSGSAVTAGLGRIPSASRAAAAFGSGECEFVVDEFLRSCSSLQDVQMQQQNGMPSRERMMVESGDLAAFLS